MKFLSVVADIDIQRKFEGALPTTIYQDDNDKNKNHNYSEVYAQNPDIDSTALVISTSSWIFEVHPQNLLYLFQHKTKKKKNERILLDL